MPPDLTGIDKAILAALLRETIARDRFPLSPRVRSFEAILDKLLRQHRERNQYRHRSRQASAAWRREEAAVTDAVAPRLVFRVRKGCKRMSTVAERVKKIVVEHLGVDEAKVTENASFIEDLGADSLDTVELVMAFEEEFGCEIPDDAAEKIATVKDAVSFIQDSGGSRVSLPEA